MGSLQNFPRASSKFDIFSIGGCGEMDRGSQCTVIELTTSSSQNLLTGGLVASSSQNSLTGTQVARSSRQNSTAGGCGSCGSDLTTIEETEGILVSDLTCGQAGGPSQNYSEVDKLNNVYNKWYKLLLLIFMSH